MPSAKKADKRTAPSSAPVEPDSGFEPTFAVDVMDADDLWIGEMIGVDTSRGSVLIVNLDGTVHAYENRCPHGGGRLSDGEFANGVIVCPIHRWEFCARNGRGINPASAQLNQHVVEIVDGRIRVIVHRQ